MSLLVEVVCVLETARIPHALIGAAALALHAVSRSTADVDLLTVDVRTLDEGLWDELGGRCDSLRVLRGDSDDPLAGTVRLMQAREIVSSWAASPGRRRSSTPRSGRPSETSPCPWWEPQG